METKQKFYKQEKGKTTPNIDVTNVSTTTDSPLMNALAYPKFPYVRSPRLLKLVASLPCQHCGNEHAVQAAHSNWSEHGKGRGIKASDIYIAALCLRCHYEIDQGDDLSKEERKEMWTQAHKRTVNALKDQWPKGVPLP